MVVEVMGRYAGWIALHAGIAGSAHSILIPEIPFDLDKVAAKVRQRDAKGRMYTLVVVAEGAQPRDGQRVVLEAAATGHQERLGRHGRAGPPRASRSAPASWPGPWCSATCSGAAAPPTFDRLAALRFGAAAVRALEEGQSGIMVALGNNAVNYVPLAEVAGRMRCVPLDGDTVQTARDLGISFGD